MKTNLVLLKKRFLQSLILGGFLVLLISGFIYSHYDSQINPRITAQIIEKNPKAKICAVVFGAAVWKNNQPSHALRDRLYTGINMYEQTAVNCLIFSGGASASGSHDEVAVMKRIALQNNVPETDIILDPNGVNTKATIHNLPENIDHFVFVSNDFHLARIKLLALKKPLKSFEVYAATYLNGRYIKEFYFFIREMLGIFWYFKYEIFFPILLFLMAKNIFGKNEKLTTVLDETYPKK